MNCICDYDCVGDPPRFIRCNRSTLCPEHDCCEACDERLVVAIVDGEKLCAECRDEPVSADQCPQPAPVAPVKRTEFVLENVAVSDLLGGALQASYTDWLEAMADEAQQILPGDEFDGRRIEALRNCLAELQIIDAEEKAAQAGRLEVQAAQ